MLHQIIEDHSFGTLVSSSAHGIVASHVPFLLDRTAGPLGTLRAHLARANEQWRDLPGREVLVVFLGPHS